MIVSHGYRHMETDYHIQKPNTFCRSLVHLYVFLNGVVIWKMTVELVNTAGRAPCSTDFFFYEIQNIFDKLLKFQFNSYQLPSLSLLNLNISWKIMHDLDANFISGHLFQYAWELHYLLEFIPFPSKFRDMQWYNTTTPFFPMTFSLSQWPSYAL